MFYILTKLFVGGSKMVALYVALIVNDRRTFEQVPAKLKAAVKADLERERYCRVTRWREEGPASSWAPILFLLRSCRGYFP